MSKKVDEVAADDVVQLCMTGTTFRGVVAYLESHGLTVSPFPADPDDLPTFMVGIGDVAFSNVRTPMRGSSA